MGSTLEVLTDEFQGKLGCLDWDETDETWAITSSTEVVEETNKVGLS